MPQPPNMQQMLKQVQKMQADMMAAQEKLKDEEVTASAGGGMVKVTISGDLIVKRVEIDPEAVDLEDVEMLADLVLASVNEALRSAQDSPPRPSAALPGRSAAPVASAGSGSRGCRAPADRKH